MTTTLGMTNEEFSAQFMAKCVEFEGKLYTRLELAAAAFGPEAKTTPLTVAMTTPAVVEEDGLEGFESGTKGSEDESPWAEPSLEDDMSNKERTLPAPKGKPSANFFLKNLAWMKTNHSIWLKFESCVLRKESKTQVEDAMSFIGDKPVFDSMRWMSHVMSKKVIRHESLVAYVKRDDESGLIADMAKFGFVEDGIVADSEASKRILNNSFMYAVADGRREDGVSKLDLDQSAASVFRSMLKTKKKLKPEIHARMADHFREAVIAPSAEHIEKKIKPLRKALIAAYDGDDEAGVFADRLATLANGAFIRLSDIGDFFAGKHGEFYDKICLALSVRGPIPPEDMRTNEA